MGKNYSNVERKRRIEEVMDQVIYLIENIFAALVSDIFPLKPFKFGFRVFFRINQKLNLQMIFSKVKFEKMRKHFDWKSREKFERNFWWRTKTVTIKLSIFSMHSNRNILFFHSFFYKNIDWHLLVS